jgi:hypothetical protein
MIVASVQTMSAGAAPSATAALGAVPPRDRPFETFADAMAGAVTPHRSVRPAAHVNSALGSRDTTLGALARQLDEVARHRLEAQGLSSDLAGALGSGMDSATLAIKMHRHARAMASYNMSVMWGAKLVGVTAGALRQLTAAS